MSHTLAASRLSRWGVAMVAAGAGMLSLATAANATVYTPATSVQFRDAVLAANANPGFDKIILPNEQAISSPTNLTIADDLLITGDHSWQAPNFQGPSLDGGSVDNPNQNFITVNPGVRFIFSGATLTISGTPGFNVIQNNGNIRIDNASLITNAAPVLNQSAGATGVIVNTIIDGNNNNGVLNAGTLTILNSTITDTQGTGVGSFGALTMRNTVVDSATGLDCFLPNGIVAESNNFDSDGNCGSATTGDPQLDFIFFYGGPTQTRPPLPGSPLINAGDNANCQTTDVRFFLRPVGAGCDIGATEGTAAIGGTPSEAVRDTIPPSCAVSAVRRGPDEQDVTLSDAESGIAYDGVFSEQITITNGAVTNPLFPAAPALPGSATRPGNRVLTAVKADQLQKTRWSFIARDWAGNVRTCS